MSYKQKATQLHTIEEIEKGLEEAHMNGYAEAEKNWWKQQDEESVRETKKLRDNDRESVLGNDTKPFKKVNSKMETKK